MVLRLKVCIAAVILLLDKDRIRLVCIRPLGPGEEITYFYGSRLYAMTGIGPEPAGKVDTKAGRSLHEEVQHGGNDD